MRKFQFVALLLLFIGVGICASAQREQAHKMQRGKISFEKMREMRANQIASQLMLSDEVSAQFKTLYNDYQKELADARSVFKKDTLFPKTDAELDARMETRFKYDSKVVSIKETYYKKFRKILTAKQTQKVFQEQPFGRFPMNKHFQHPNMKGHGTPKFVPNSKGNGFRGRHLQGHAPQPKEK